MRPHFPLVDLAEATAARKKAEKEWQSAVRRAAKSNSLREVAPFAGVSHARVAQIVKEQ